jgi:hypothetical protein
MNALVGFALTYAEQASLDYLQGIGFEVDEDEEQPIVRCRQGAVLLDGKLAGGPGFPIKAPRGHMRLERRLEGGDQGLKLLEGQARGIQELRRTRLHIVEPNTGHTWCLLSWEAQYTIIGINSITPRCHPL